MGEFDWNEAWTAGLMVILLVAIFSFRPLFSSNAGKAIIKEKDLGVVDGTSPHEELVGKKISEISMPSEEKEYHEWRSVRQIEKRAIERWREENNITEKNRKRIFSLVIGLLLAVSIYSSGFWYIKRKYEGDNGRANK